MIKNNAGTMAERYKFTDTEYDINNSIFVDLQDYYANGGKYKKDAPYHQYTCNFSEKPFTRITEELLRSGYKRVMGWVIDFRNIWKKYLVNIQYYGWVEVYAPSKMAIRDTFGNHTIKDKIIELEG